jgi:hypothetical protein
MLRSPIPIYVLGLHLLVGSSMALDIAPISSSQEVRGARALCTWAAADQPPWQRLAGEARRLAQTLDVQIHDAADAAMANQPDAAARITRRLTPPPTAGPAAAAIVLYRGTSATDVQAAWRRQLHDTLDAVAGLLEAEPTAVREWMMAWVEAKPGIDGFFRREHARDYLMEAAKLAELLDSPPPVQRISIGETLVTDDFAAPSPRWRMYGPGSLDIGQGVLRLHGNGTSVICDRPADDALIAFDFTPVAIGAAGPGGPGCLFAFPATPLGSQGFAASAGPMVDYNDGIDTYHVSLFRGATGCSNLRRTGRGLRMLSHVEPDPCAQLGRTYHIELLRLGASMQVYVDGRLIHAYLDGGAFGPPPAAGCFGLRAFSGGDLELTLSGFRMCRLAIIRP